MIYFDRTNAGRSNHRSGLMRVSARLHDELGPSVTAVRWPDWNRRVRGDDWYFTSELFSDAERPGFAAFVQGHSCRLAAVFHDAIPLKYPQITWPHSVARHPGYMKLLAGFDRIWAVSAASKRDLEGFWRWQGLTRTPLVDVLPLGADFNHGDRVERLANPPPGIARLLCLGILEPRKNQAFLLEVCERLWREGVGFELHFVGRVNPHFGAPIVVRIRELSRRYRGAVTLHRALPDPAVLRLYHEARATVFPTMAEGCGLPLIESLWMGVPCLCSDLPVLRENAEGGGCLPVPVGDFDAWTEALRRVLKEDGLIARLTAEAAARSLPTWSQSAATIRRGLE